MSRVSVLTSRNGFRPFSGANGLAGDYGCFREAKAARARQFVACRELRRSEQVERKANFMSVAWFWDQFQRGLLNMSPPYQRRSVWNQEYKDYFVDTVLNGFPAPAVFLYQETSPEGVQRYKLVDGKQRLSTLFDFANNCFPVSDHATMTALRNKYFKDLPDEVRKRFWEYQFSVEYLPSEDEGIINNIFDRINRNVARLTRQELRHARFSGEFIEKVQELSEWMAQTLPANFPLIAARSKKQMKDDELIAELLLLIEEGPKSYSQDDLDEAFSARDEIWEQRDRVVAQFKKVVEVLRDLASGQFGTQLVRSRFKNQTDFYSLFGAIHELTEACMLPGPDHVAECLVHFIEVVEDGDQRGQSPQAKEYYEAARSASNDAGPRRKRIDIIKSVILKAQRSA